MQCLTFSRHKQKILEFVADGLEFGQEQGGLMLTCSGEITFQDTPLVEQVAQQDTPLHVELTRDGETVLDQTFEVMFFTLEPDRLAALLH